MNLFKKTNYSILLIGLSVVLFLFIFTSCAKKAIDLDELVSRNGMYYLPNETRGYTGDVFALDDDSDLKTRGKLKNGLKDGKLTSWYENGQKQSEGFYKDGARHGKLTSWYENGQKELETKFKNGLGHGQQTATSPQCLDHFQS